MADSDSEGKAPAAESTPPQAGTTSTETPAAPPAGDQSGSESLSLDEARKLRSEAHSLRQRLAAAERQVKSHEEAQLSEQERLQRRAADAEQRVTDVQTRYQTRLDEAEIRLAAQRLGFADPTDAMRLLDRESIDRDDDGVLKGAAVGRALERLAEAKPYLLTSSLSAPGGAAGRVPIPGTPRPAGPPNAADLLEQHKSQLRRTGRYAV